MCPQPERGRNLATPSAEARPKTHPLPKRGRKVPSALGEAVLRQLCCWQPTTKQTQWFRFESCWSPPLGTVSRQQHSLPEHPTGVEPKLEPDRNFRLHAARRSHPKGLRLEGETYKLQTLHSETTGTSPHFPQTFVEAEIHALTPWSRPKFPQDLPRPNFLHLHPSDQSRGRNFLRQHAEAVFLESVGASQTTSRVSFWATLLTHQLRHVACPA